MATTRVFRLPSNSQLDSFLTQTSASTNYLTKSSASTIYATKANFPEGIWTQFTLTTTNISFGTGASILSFYTKVGKTVFVRIFLQLGSGGSLSGNPTFSLPVTPRLSYINPLNNISYSLTQNVVGNSLCLNGAGGQFPGSVYINNSGAATCTVQNTAGAYSQDVSLSSTVPFTWTSYNTIYLECFYESV
jgi:hypothetical protein